MKEIKIRELRTRFIQLTMHTHAHSLLVQRGYSSKTEAVEQVKKGNAWAAVVIGSNFTVDLFKRANHFTNATINDGSTIYLYMDITSEEIAAKAIYI